MRGRPLHVLMTADAVGGVWTYATALVGALADRGVTITLAVIGPPPEAHARRVLDALPHVSYRHHGGRLEWMPDAAGDVERTGRWLLDLAAENPPDVVHLNGYAHAACPFPCRVLVVAHSCVRSWWRAVKGSEPPPDRDGYTAAVRRGLDRAALVVAPTGAMLTSLGREYSFARPAIVLPNGLPWRAVHGERRQPLVLAAGRLWDEAKNLAALDSVAERLPWPVAVAGDTSLDGGGHAVPHRVRALGRLSADDLARWMARAPIYALPARYEPFGLSVLEAAQQGCALVLGDIPSLRELWDGAAAFVPPDDHEALARALRSLIEHDDVRRRLAGAARARAARFSDRSCADRYLYIYRALARTVGEAVACAS